MCLDWNAVGAIGQWFGAGVTLFALLIAMNADKTRFTIKISEIPRYYERSPEMSFPHIKFSVINKRNYSVKIIEAGFITGEGKKVKYANYFSGLLPNADKFQQFEIDGGVFSQELIDTGYSGKNIIYFYIRDDSDRIHKNSFVFDIQKKERIKRIKGWLLKWWLCFCGWVSSLHNRLTN